MTIHKRKCVCGHMLDVEEVYQLGMKDALGKNLLKDCENCKASMISQIREDAIDECMRAIVNTESKVFNPCADKEQDVLANRQFEILNILKQLKGAENE